MVSVDVQQHRTSSKKQKNKNSSRCRRHLLTVAHVEQTVDMYNHIKQRRRRKLFASERTYLGAYKALSGPIQFFMLGAIIPIESP